jgi:hypothetical protein
MFKRTVGYVVRILKGEKPALTFLAQAQTDAFGPKGGVSDVV